MVTERDVKVLKFMSGFSWMMAEQVAKLMGVSLVIARRRLKALGELGLVEAENVLGSRRLFYRVSREGLDFLGAGCGVVCAEGC